MAKKKAAPKKTAAPEKPLYLKIAGGIGQLAGKIVAEKNHLVEIAGGSIDSMKETIHNITVKKKVLRKTVNSKEKKAISKPVAAATKKIIKAAPAKPAPKKAIKKVAKKIAKKK